MEAVEDIFKYNELATQTNTILMEVDKKAAESHTIPTTISIYNNSCFAIDVLGAVAISSGISWMGSHVSGSLASRISCEYKNSVIK